MFRRLRTVSLFVMTFCGMTACSVTLEDNFLFWVPKDIDFLETEEAGTALFMGRALVEPIDRDLTARGYWTTKVEFRLRSEEFIATSIEHERLVFDGGELAVLRVDRQERRVGDPVFLHCAGIGQSLYNNGVQHALKLLPYGDVIQFDMPGHGMSGGEATIEDLDAAVTAMADYAVREANGRPLVFYGHSLGGYICAGMAARALRADGLVIEASGQDAETVANAWVPTGINLLFRIRTSDLVDVYNIPDMLMAFEPPVLVIGGEHDQIVPERLVRKMAGILEQNERDVTYVEMEEVDHSTIPFASAFDPTLTAFVSQLTRPRL